MGAVKKFMEKLGIGSYTDDEEFEDYNDSEDVDDESYEEESEYQRGNRRSFTDIQKDYSTRSMQSKVIPMETAVSSSKMVITEPSCYESVQEIGEYLKLKKAVIINLENVSKEEARRILDFLSGATFMIDGTIQKVSNLIYLMTPRNVEIQDDTKKDEYKQQKLSFSWLK